MELLIVMLGVAVAGALVVVLALGLSAKKADIGHHDTGWLLELVAMRSPTGRPFFGSKKAMRDLISTLKDVDDGQRGGR